MVVLVCFFFFKQKTAYELRISDWSSDVCSSDLASARRLDNQRAGRARRDAARLDDGPVDQQRRAFRQPVDRYRVATIAKQDGAAGGQGHGPAGPTPALRKMNVLGPHGGIEPVGPAQGEGVGDDDGAAPQLSE